MCIVWSWWWRSGLISADDYKAYKITNQPKIEKINRLLERAAQMPKLDKLFTAALMKLSKDIRLLHSCDKEPDLRQKGGKAFDFVLKKFKIEILGDIAWWSD